MRCEELPGCEFNGHDSIRALIVVRESMGRNNEQGKRKLPLLVPVNNYRAKSTEAWKIV